MLYSCHLPKRQLVMPWEGALLIKLTRLIKLMYICPIYSIYLFFVLQIRAKIACPPKLNCSRTPMAWLVKPVFSSLHPLCVVVSTVI